MLLHARGGVAPVLSGYKHLLFISRFLQDIEYIRSACMYAHKKATLVKLSLGSRAESAESAAKLLERNRALEDENNKLSRELSEAAGQTALMFEKIIAVRQTKAQFTHNFQKPFVLF